MVVYQILIFSMKKVVIKSYSIKDVDNIISNFSTSGNLFGKADRNIIKLFDLNGITVNVKSFKIPGLTNKIVYKYFRKSKAQRSLEYASKLQKLGIGTPKPIAYYEYFSFIGLQKSYYVCEHINYDLTFRELITNPGYPDHNNILRQFTKFTWQLHEKGIYFKDHSPGNTLIIKNSENYDFYLVDLNRMSFVKLDLEARMKNFSRLTPKKEMIYIMSDEYAKLSGENFEKVYEKMWFYTQQFQDKFHRKKQLKQTLFGKK